MSTRNLIIILVVLVLIAAALAAVTRNPLASVPSAPSAPLDPTPKSVTLSGTYVCLPHLDTAGPQTEECAFGIQTDDGTYYAVNFGQSAGAMEQFMAGARITAEGFTIIREALSSDHWAKYDMAGVFTVTRMLDAAEPMGAPVQGKIDINAVCEGALAYMTFPDGAAADRFVAECKEGEHPEVIEQYKAQMGVGDGAAI